MVKARAILKGALIASLPVLAFGQATPLPPPAAPVISDPSNLTAVYEAMVGTWFNAVSPYAYDLFFALAALDIAVFGWDLWRTYHGDIRNALLATANKVMIIGFFLALPMNGGTWMADIINMFVTVGKTASGVPGLGPAPCCCRASKSSGHCCGRPQRTASWPTCPRRSRYSSEHSSSAYRSW